MSEVQIADSSTQKGTHWRQRGKKRSKNTVKAIVRDSLRDAHPEAVGVSECAMFAAGHVLAV